MAIPELLVQRRGCVVSADAILTHLYSRTDLPESRIIEVFICKIRRKLAQAGSKDVIKRYGEKALLSAQPPTDRRGIRPIIAKTAVG